MKCKDFLISNEEFDLVSYKNYEILKTVPVPNNIDEYYKTKEYISHTNTNKGIINILYQLVKKKTIRDKYKLIKNIYPQARSILDIGAGTGDFIYYFKNKDWKIYGVEPSENARKIALRKNIILNKEYPKNQKFDIITLWHVLEHIPNIEEILSKLKGLLNTKGKLIIAVPNYKSWDAKYYKQYWAAYDVPRHLWHFSKKGLTDILRDNNWKIEKTKPMWFDAFYVSMLSEKYKKSPFFLGIVRAIIIGFISNIQGFRKRYSFSSNIFIFSSFAESLERTNKKI